jgi:hypothetical protein
VKYKKVKQEELKIGDTMHSVLFGDETIIGFEEYSGPFDFIARIASFAGDGIRMSLTKGYRYEIVDMERK